MGIVTASHIKTKLLNLRVAYILLKQSVTSLLKSSKNIIFLPDQTHHAEPEHLIPDTFHPLQLKF